MGFDSYFNLILLVPRDAYTFSVPSEISKDTFSHSEDGSNHPAGLLLRFQYSLFQYSFIKYAYIGWNSIFY